MVLEILLISLKANAKVFQCDRLSVIGLYTVYLYPGYCIRTENLSVIDKSCTVIVQLMHKLRVKHCSDCKAGVETTIKSEIVGTVAMQSGKCVHLSTCFVQ